MKLPVQAAVCWDRAVGAPIVESGAHALAVGMNLPPVSKSEEPSLPPQTMTSMPVQTAVCQNRGDGAPDEGSAVQEAAAAS
jgi:hypothetical protein